MRFTNTCRATAINRRAGERILTNVRGLWPGLVIICSWIVLILAVCKQITNPPKLTNLYSEFPKSNFEERMQFARPAALSHCKIVLNWVRVLKIWDELLFVSFGILTMDLKMQIRLGGSEAHGSSIWGIVTALLLNPQCFVPYRVKSERTATATVTRRPQRRPSRPLLRQSSSTRPSQRLVKKQTKCCGSLTICY